MLLLSSLNLLLDGRRSDDSRPHGGGNGKTEFPDGQLTLQPPGKAGGTTTPPSRRGRRLVPAGSRLSRGSG